MKTKKGHQGEIAGGVQFENVGFGYVGAERVFCKISALRWSQDRQWLLLGKQDQVRAVLLS